MIIFQNTSYGKIELDCENRIIVTPLNVQPNDTDGIRLVVVKVSNCENSNVLELFGTEEKLYETLIYDNIILENTIKTIPLPYDGTYFLRIRDYYSKNEETVSFTTYNNFISSLLDKTKQLFCGCNSCNLLNLFKENNTKELELLTNYNILFSLLNENNNLTCLNCEFEELIKCDYINENFKNKNQFNVFKSNLLIANLFNNLCLYLQNKNIDCFEKITNQIKLCLKKNNITIKTCNQNNASADPFARIFDTNSVSATLPFGFVILKEYNIGKLSELNAIQLYFTLQTLGNSADGYIQIIDSSNNIVLSNYLNLAASNFIYNYSREHFIIDKLNNKIKFIDVQNSFDTTAVGTYAYANTTFNPLEDYKVRFSIRTLGSDPTILEHVMINLL